jgi:hypothetical protein
VWRRSRRRSWGRAGGDGRRRLVTGVDGFGFAVVGTASLAAAVADPAIAVVVMVLPMLRKL